MQRNKKVVLITKTNRQYAKMTAVGVILDFRKMITVQFCVKICSIPRLIQIGYHTPAVELVDCPQKPVGPYCKSGKSD